MIVVAGLAACGSGGSGSSGPTVSHRIGDFSNGVRVSCSPGLAVVDLPIGQKVERDGATFTLTEQKPAGTQESVTLDIKLGPAGLPAIIVRDRLGSVNNDSGDWNDGKPVNVGMAPGGTAHYVFTPAGFSNLSDSEIVMVTLCLDTNASAPPPSSPAPTRTK